jgi:hypothetical protein
MASQNPPWLDALLAQAYPGNSSDMSMFPAVNSGDPRPDVNMQMGMVTPPTAGGYPVAGGDPRAVDAAMNMNTGMAPGSFGGTMVPRRPVAGPPRPNPSNVGGAPSPGIPAPLGANRTGNNLNPNYSLVQYGVGGGAQGPRNAPIYTAGNFGGPQNAGWGQQGQFPQQAQPQQPRGALAANPQGGGSGFNVGGMFQNLPDDIFNNSPQPSMNRQGATGTPYGPSPNALPQAQKYGWPFQMVG